MRDRRNFKSSGTRTDTVQSVSPFDGLVSLTGPVHVQHPPTHCTVRSTPVVSFVFSFLVTSRSDGRGGDADGSVAPSWDLYSLVVMTRRPDPLTPLDSLTGLCFLCVTGVGPPHTLRGSDPSVLTPFPDHPLLVSST